VKRADELSPVKCESSADSRRVALMASGVARMLRALVQRHVMGPL